MTAHERFRFRTPEQFAEARSQALDLPWSDDIGRLLAPLTLGTLTVPNRLAIQPMEGADADENGSPGPLTFRRYRRFAAGGAGLIWFEAAAVVPEGRSNAHQLLLVEENLPAFKRLVEETRAEAADGPLGRRPVLLLQLTHAGRFAKCGGFPAPLAAQRNPHLDSLRRTDREFPLITDSELDALKARFAEAAELAADAGFDGVDLKACHGYLAGELLAARARTESRYGGAHLENRARLLIEAAAEIKRRRPDRILAVRLGVCDGLAAPYGFGGAADDPERPDLAEPIAVVRELRSRGLDLLNVTLGIPSFRPHLGRPFDRPPAGGAFPPEHPLTGVARLLKAAAGMQAAFPGLPVVGTGFSWLRQHFPGVASGAIGRGDIALAGVGRLAFAAPDFALDLRRTGALSPRKVCVACSHCSELLRAGRPAGCVVRDSGVYRVA
jgi:2,4-dienoyl-CoA reductase-like NADH-dependent reductase (Old Yellow Enzyme family)